MAVRLDPIEPLRVGGDPFMDNLGRLRVDDLVVSTLNNGNRAGDFIQVASEIVDSPTKLVKRTNGNMAVVGFRVLRFVQAEGHDPFP